LSRDADCSGAKESSAHAALFFDLGEGEPFCSGQLIEQQPLRVAAHDGCHAVLAEPGVQQRLVTSTTPVASNAVDVPPSKSEPRATC
jgi:hypothetical protein